MYNLNFKLNTKNDTQRPLTNGSQEPLTIVYNSVATGKLCQAHAHQCCRLP